MISVTHALETVLNAAKRLPPISVSLHEALGKVLAQNVHAVDPLPPYPASVKVRFYYLLLPSFLFTFHFTQLNYIGPGLGLLEQDGYAVVAGDGPGEYPVIAESRAGDDAVDVTVVPGTVAYVTTGGV